MPVRTAAEIVASLRGETPTDVTPDMSAPELDEPTVEPGDDAKARAERRAAMNSTTLPVSANRSAEDHYKDIARFAIISRFLAFNATNEQIIEELANAGFPMGLRTMQRLLKRDDFKRYYENFQGEINTRIRKLMEESFIMAVPEAYNHLIRLMRAGRSSETQRQAANDIFKYAGFGRQDGSKSLHIHLPPEMAKALADEGKRVVSGTMKVLQTAPAPPVIDVESEEVVDEPSDTSAD